MELEFIQNYKILAKSVSSMDLSLLSAFHRETLGFEPVGAAEADVRTVLKGEPVVALSTHNIYRIWLGQYHEPKDWEGVHILLSPRARTTFSTINNLCSINSMTYRGICIIEDPDLTNQEAHIYRVSSYGA